MLKWFSRGVNTQAPNLQLAVKNLRELLLSQNDFLL